MHKPHLFSWIHIDVKCSQFPLKWSIIAALHIYISTNNCRRRPSGVCSFLSVEDTVIKHSLCWLTEPSHLPPLWSAAHGEKQPRQVQPIDRPPHYFHTTNQCAAVPFACMQKEERQTADPPPLPSLHYTSHTPPADVTSEKRNYSWETFS